MSQPLSVSEYRELFRARHDAEGVVEESARDGMALVFNLTRLSTRLNQEFESVHRRLGWSWAGFRIMNVLWVAGAMELRHIARLSGASKAAISSALNTLERDGLVARVRDEGDRRLVRVALTERGHEQLRRGMEAQVEVERIWFAALDPDDRHTLVRLLGTLADQPTPES